MRACIGDEPECNGPYCGHSENCRAYIEMSKEDSHCGCGPENEHATEREEGEMTLDEAIEHAKEVACSCKNKECAEDHRQLAQWLEELREYRKAGEKLDGRPITSMAEYRLHVASYRKMVKELNAKVEKLTREIYEIKESANETERRS